MASRTGPPEELPTPLLERISVWCFDHDDPGIRARDARLSELIPACLDHHRAKGTLAADWTAVIRTWIRNDLAYARRDGREVSMREAIARDAVQAEQDETARIWLAAHPSRPEPVITQEYLSLVQGLFNGGQD